MTTQVSQDEMHRRYQDRRSAARSPIGCQDTGIPHDETFGDDGAALPSEHLAHVMGVQGDSGLRALQSGVRRLVNDDGITYGVPPEGRRAGP